jgi:hypothetical protein
LVNGGAFFSVVISDNAWLMFNVSLHLFFWYVRVCLLHGI